MLAKEKEEAVKDRDQTKKLLDDLRKKYEIDATGCKVKVKQTSVNRDCIIPKIVVTYL